MDDSKVSSGDLLALVNQTAALHSKAACVYRHWPSHLYYIYWPSYLYYIHWPSPLYYIHWLVICIIYWL